MELIVHEETWPYIDEFFRSVPEAMQKVPTFQEALEARERAGRREGEREGKREGKREGEREGTLLTQRRTLLRFLRHKFGELPAAVVQLIETTVDSAQLDRWLDQVFEATALADMQFDVDSGHTG